MGILIRDLKLIQDEGIRQKIIVKDHSPVHILSAPAKTPGAGLSAPGDLSGGRGRHRISLHCPLPRGALCTFLRLLRLRERLPGIDLKLRFQLLIAGILKLQSINSDLIGIDRLFLIAARPVEIEKTSEVKEIIDITELKLLPARLFQDDPHGVDPELIAEALPVFSHDLKLNALSPLRIRRLHPLLHREIRFFHKLKGNCHRLIRIRGVDVHLIDTVAPHIALPGRELDDPILPMLGILDLRRKARVPIDRPVLAVQDPNAVNPPKPLLLLLVIHPELCRDAVLLDARAVLIDENRLHIVFRCDRIAVLRSRTGEIKGRPGRKHPVPAFLIVRRGVAVIF